MKMKKFYCRVCWNTRGWTEPSAAAADAESQSYASENAFGHEEWLFNNSRQVDGWRYSHLQPVARSRSRLLEQGSTPIEVHLWTKDPNDVRWFIGKISRCEVISTEDAKGALKEYKTRGWLREMASQLRALELDGREIKHPRSPESIFNVRFKPSDAVLFDTPVRIPVKHPVHDLRRYTLVDYSKIPLPTTISRRSSTSSKTPRTRNRRAIAATQISQEHDFLQQQIYKFLAGKYGPKNVLMEENHVDIRCAIDKKLHFIEIKSEPRPKLAIREAIGQLLEYAYFPPHTTPEPCLHVAAPGSMTPEVRNYLELIRKRFRLHVRYHQISRDTDSIDLDS